MMVNDCKYISDCVMVMMLILWRWKCLMCQFDVNIMVMEMCNVSIWCEHYDDGNMLTLYVKCIKKIVWLVCVHGHWLCGRNLGLQIIWIKQTIATSCLPSLFRLQLRASRAYLGVPKQTPIPGIFSEMNWPEPRSRTQIKMVRHYHRMLKIDDNRLIKKVFSWEPALWTLN